MTFYPDTAAIWNPPGPVTIDPTGTGRFDFPPGDNIPGFDCPFIEDPDPTKPIATTLPYRLPGPVVCIGTVAYMVYSYDVMYWWEDQENGQQTISSVEFANTRFTYYRNGGAWWQSAGMKWVYYQASLADLGWNQYLAYDTYNQVRREDPAFRCKYGINPDNPGQYYYYEATQLYRQVLTNTWVYAGYIQSGKRGPGLAPALLAAALLGLPLSGLLSSTSTTDQAGSVRRPRRKKTPT